MFQDLNPPKTVERPEDSPIYRDPSIKPRLGDRVERLAKPIAKQINKAGHKLQTLSTWMIDLGKPGSKCGCKSRKQCLNKIEIDLKHPCRLISEILQCWFKKNQKH